MEYVLREVNEPLGVSSCFVSLTAEALTLTLEPRAPSDGTSLIPSEHLSLRDRRLGGSVGSLMTASAYRLLPYPPARYTVDASDGRKVRKTLPSETDGGPWCLGACVEDIGVSPAGRSMSRSMRVRILFPVVETTHMNTPILSKPPVHSEMTSGELRLER